MKKIANFAAAGRSTKPPTANYCAAWACGVYASAGFGYPNNSGSAIGLWDNYKMTGSSKFENIPPGAMIITSGYPYNRNINNPYGHVGIYLGDGNVISNVGGLRKESLQSFVHGCTGICRGHKGGFGWVLPGGPGK